MTKSAATKNSLASVAATLGPLRCWNEKPTEGNAKSTCRCNARTNDSASNRPSFSTTWNPTCTRTNRPPATSCSSTPRPDDDDDGAERGSECMECKGITLLESLNIILLKVTIKYKY